MTVCIDENTLKAIVALQRPGKPDLLSKIVGLFMTESPKTLADLLGGIDTMDMEAVRVAAHTLKSSSAYVGATDFSNRCKELEHAAHEQNFPACIALGEGVDDLFKDSCSALELRLSNAA